MKLKRFNFLAGILSVSALGLLSACATTSAPVKTAPAAAIAPDISQPTSPIGAFVIEAPKPTVAKPVALPERGSVASVVQKMESSEYTLYWKDNDSYSYYVGGLLDAEYQTGGSLTVQEDKGDDSGITCQFDANGKLTTATVRVEQKSGDVCSQLMFTLDDELSD